LKQILAHFMPPDYSAHGPEVDGLIADMHIMIAVLLFFWLFYFIFVLVRFRARKQGAANYEGLRSRWPLYLVAVVMAVEFLHLFAFSIPAWARWATPLSAAEKPLEIHVIGEQFAWNVHYPGPDGIFGRRDIKLVTSSNPLGLDPNDPRGKDDVVTLNQLHMQVGRPMLIHLSSKDVIHSFFLPYMRVKQDAIPGIEVAIHFTPVKEGEKDFEIACAQLCGLGHYRMRGQYAVHNKAGFDRWLAENAPQKTTAVAVTAPVPAPAAGTSPARSSIQPVS
jgi:cytochrome c oxidase subunit 2